MAEEEASRKGWEGCEEKSRNGEGRKEKLRC